MTNNVIQFTNLNDFVVDLTAGDTLAIYHDLIEQRTASNDYGITRWQMSTIIRALVADSLTNGRAIAHVAALTIPHGAPIERLYGRVFGPPGSAAAAQARWQPARDQHDVIIDELQNRLYDHAGGEPGLINRVRSGILNIPTHRLRRPPFRRVGGYPGGPGYIGLAPQKPSRPSAMAGSYP